MCVDVFSIEVVIAWRFCFALPPSLSLSSRFKEVAAECTAAKIGFAEFCYLFVGIPVGQQASCSFGLGGTTSAPPQLL